MATLTCARRCARPSRTNPRLPDADGEGARRKQQHLTAQHGCTAQATRWRLVRTAAWDCSSARSMLPTPLALMTPQMCIPLTNTQTLRCTRLDSSSRALAHGELQHQVDAVRCPLSRQAARLSSGKVVAHGHYPSLPRCRTAAVPALESSGTFRRESSVHVAWDVALVASLHSRRALARTRWRTNQHRRRHHSDITAGAARRLFECTVRRSCRSHGDNQSGAQLGSPRKHETMTSLVTRTMPPHLPSWEQACTYRRPHRTSRCASREDRLTVPRSPLPRAASGERGIILHPSAEPPRQAPARTFPRGRSLTCCLHPPKRAPCRR